jgi:CheY-like chemotaxis protein/anti-sigma regulatory factor (Ser/Thr protein kinase)
MTAATILLVDDEPFNLDILLEYLEDAGYALDVAEDGRQAWEKLEAAPENFDVVLLDRMMPGLSGLEVLERMKAHPVLQSVPVILQTALAARAEIVEGMQAGAYYYLTKPFEEAMLLSVLQTAVADRQRYRLAQEDSKAAGRTFGLLREATFVFRTPESARDLAVVLANAFPDPKRVAIGLTELLLNAVEHGNLGISYEEKGRLREEERWSEEVAARLADPAYAGREVTVVYRRDDDEIRVRIQDQGDGFEFQRYLEMDPARAFDSHGRGIAMARMLSFDTIDYLGRGNEVEVSIALSPPMDETAAEAAAR